MASVAPSSAADTLGKKSAQFSVDAPAFVPGWHMAGGGTAVHDAGDCGVPYYTGADVAQDISYCAFNMDQYDSDDDDAVPQFKQERTYEQVRCMAGGLGYYDEVIGGHYDDVSGRRDESASAAPVCLVNLDEYSDDSDLEQETVQKQQPQVQQLPLKAKVPPSPASRGAESPATEPLAEPSPTGSGPDVEIMPKAPAAPERDTDELPPSNIKAAKSEAKAEAKDLHSKIFGGRVPPWRSASAWSNGKEGLTAAKKAAAAEVAEEVSASRATGAWPDLSALKRLPPWRRPKAAKPETADDSGAKVADKQAEPRSSSSSSSSPAPEASDLERLSSEASSEPEAEISDANESSEDSPSGSYQVMNVLQLLLWSNSAPALDAEGLKYQSVATSELVSLYPALAESAGVSPHAGRDQAAATPTRRSTGTHKGQDKTAEKRPARESRDIERRPMRESTSKLQNSENSWAAQQKARRSNNQEAEDASVVRNIKSILNKLTVEKFVQLYHQLLDCGIRTTEHVELLIQEVFEKATTQHHFIDMYADLCTLVHEHFAESPIGNDPKFSFKRLLLNECQSSFERHLTPPAGLAEMEAEERTEAEVRYKTKMLGNIKLVGALLARKMLASKVMLAILEELLADPTPEALESLAALLAAVGPTFDTPDWVHQPALAAIFMQVKTIAGKPTCEPRARCLLKDVLDLRAAGWKDRKPKRMEGPTTLGQVAKMANADERSTPAATPITLDDRRAAVAATARLSKTLLTPVPEKTVAIFDQSAFRKEMTKVLQELRVSYDAPDAAARLADQAAPPHGHQSQEICHLLAEVVQEGKAEARKAGFEMLACFFSKGMADSWSRQALSGGLQVFCDEVCPDLACDVPVLPRILREELKPVFAPLVQQGLLEAAQLESFAN